MEIKKAKNSDWKKIDKFLTNHLRANATWSLREEYPLTFSDKNIHNIHFIEEDNEVVAHAVIQPSLIKTHYHLFKVALIGSVVTNEKNRGQGLSTEIIKSCIEDAKNQFCDLAILWTDLFNFYSKFGFEVAGTEIALQIDQNYRGQVKPNLKIIEGNKVSASALLGLFNKHQLRSVRNAADVEKYMNIPQTEIYTAWNSLNQLEAYCVLGKGADFTNYVHEWGGQVSAIESLVKHIAVKKQARITLISPPQCTNLIKTMEDHGAEKFFGVLGMIKIINPDSFCKKIKKGARALGYDAFVFEYRDGIYYFGYGDEIYKTDSDQDITRLAFGPLNPEQIHQFSEQALNALKDIFPIPFWVWGWDSI